MRYRVTERRYFVARESCARNPLSIDGPAAAYSLIRDAQMIPDDDREHFVLGDGKFVSLSEQGEMM